MEINIQNVSMTYPNGKQALKNLSLNLRSPSLVGLLGPNGAGKSTLMKLLVARASANRRRNPAGRAAPRKKRTKAEGRSGLPAPGLRAV